MFSNLIAARAQMGTSLVFHVIFSALGVGLPLLLFLSPVAHWLTSIPIVISGLSSAWFIISANSWMNSPTGFQLVNGKVTNVDPFAAILNPSTPFETTHMILACYVATGFGAAVYAVGMLRGTRDDYHRKALLLGMLMGGAAIPFQIISGDFNARSLEITQPLKYAAMEGQKKINSRAWFILTIILHFLAEFLIIVGYGMETIDIEM